MAKRQVLVPGQGKPLPGSVVVVVPEHVLVAIVVIPDEGMDGQIVDERGNLQVVEIPGGGRGTGEAVGIDHFLEVAVVLVFP